MPIRQRLIDVSFMAALVGVGYACGTRDKAGNETAIAQSDASSVARMTEILVSIDRKLDVLELLAEKNQETGRAALRVMQPFGESFVVKPDELATFTVKPDTYAEFEVKAATNAKFVVEPDTLAEFKIKAPSNGIEVRQATNATFEVEPSYSAKFKVEEANFNGLKVHN